MEIARSYEANGDTLLASGDLPQALEAYRLALMRYLTLIPDICDACGHTEQSNILMLQGKIMAAEIVYGRNLDTALRLTCSGRIAARSIVNG